MKSPESAYPSRVRIRKAGSLLTSPSETAINAAVGLARDVITFADSASASCHAFRQLLLCGKKFGFGYDNWGAENPFRLFASF